MLDVTVDNIATINERFGKMIPFVVPRGALSRKDYVEEYKKTITEALKKIDPKEAEKMIDEEAKNSDDIGQEIDYR